MTQIRTLSQLLLDLKSELDGHTVSVGQILDAFHERGFGFFLFLFALPAALPLPAVGIGTVLGLPLLFLTAQLALRRHTIWMPESVRKRTLERAQLMKFIDIGLPWVRRLEILVRPRLGWITHGAVSAIIGVLGFIMACSVLLPIPLTNTVPSFGIALMAVGIIMRDGLAVLAGAVAGIAWIAALILLGSAGLKALAESVL